MLELIAIIFIVMVAWALVATAAILLKCVVWLVLLPFRLLFAILLLPFLLIKAIVGGVLMVIVLPILAIAGIVAAIALAAAVLVPLLPVLFIALAIWFVIRASQRPAVAR